MRSGEYTVLGSKIHLLELKGIEYLSDYISNVGLHISLQNTP